MNGVETIKIAARNTGYRDEAVINDYTFADVLDESGETRKVPLVAFTSTPPSYRSAAFAVIDGKNKESFRLVNEHRALCAPFLFVIDGKNVTVWQVRTIDPPRVIEKTTVAKLPSLFKRNNKIWNPGAIHRAKSIGAVEKGYQLDFVDIGLLPAIEGEIHSKLDRLLLETLAAASNTPGGRSIDIRLLFRVVFRLLSAKVLQDRKHPYSESWNSEDLASVLKKIESYYSLTIIPETDINKKLPALSAAWNCLRLGINFSNISADDLAFVYENTLVTAESRKLFGTHSTPRQVAEYIVQRMEFHRYEPEKLKIYEPFAGAGVFLVSALRHLRDRLPVDWSDQRRHNFLIKRLAGDELDSFACEVANLSLILADYPHHNGWNINKVDLFDEGVLEERMSVHNVILCNPPFGPFNSQDRAKYSITSTSYSKAVAVLDAAINAHPIALGFVLPRAFILEKKFIDQRRKIEQLYGNVELVELPDRTFGAAVIDTAVLIATEPRPSSSANITLISTEIAGRDRNIFLKTGKITTQRHLTRPVSESDKGDLWIPSLGPLWQYLDSYPRLETKLRPSRGIEWNYNQTMASSGNRQKGYRKGLDTARNLKQFMLNQTVWLDFQPDSLRCNYDKDWDLPKLIMNSARLSRGPWRIGASLETKGLLYSQQFYGLWPIVTLRKRDLLALSAVLNGPVANAFMSVHSPSKMFRAKAISQIPIPKAIPDRLADLVHEYSDRLANPQALGDDDEYLEALLMQIDALVLEAYDLPPRIEKELLSYFLDADRPVAHPWTHWDIAKPAPGLRLAERMSGNYPPKPDWIADVFRPLPEREAVIFRELVE